jgi:hypothetical protein
MGGLHNGPPFFYVAWPDFCVLRLPRLGRLNMVECAPQLIIEV